ncbi:MAG: EAL domain-containing protein [Synergistaceae bacterium]|nr:EAL domain-containing protein [Synergistaceae bacterium]
MRLDKLIQGKKAVVFWSGIANLEYLGIIRNALTLTLPVVIAGAMGVLINNFPVAIYQTFMQDVFGDGWRSFGSYVWDGTLAVLSPVMVFTIGFNIAERYNLKNPLDAIHPVIVGLLAFCSLLAIMEPSTKDFAIPYNWVGIHGLFLAIITGVVSAEFFISLYKRRILRVRFFSEESGAAMSGVFSALIPAIATISAFALFKVFMSTLGVNDIHSLIYGMISRPFAGLGNNLGAAVLYNFARQFLWFLGIHGSNAMEPVMTEIYVSAMKANELAISLGETQPFIITKTFFDTYVSMGGAGNTLSLLIALFTVKKGSGMKKIAQISLLPAVFNINETLLFGMPLVLNPIYIFPFIATPIALTVVTYYVASFGLLPSSGAEVAWTTPVFLSGYAAAGSAAGSVMQLVNLSLGFLIYLPFVHVAERVQRFKFEATYNELLKASGNLESTYATLTDRPGEIGAISRVLANDLLNSIKRNELFLEYQPQVDCTTGRVVGVEALLRWKHANIGRVPPSLFIVLAEEIGFIDEIGIWVCEESCRQVKEWRDKGLTGVVMSFNVSVKQLGDADLPEKILDCIEKYGLDPSCMKAEVTESTGLSSDMGHNILLEEIRRLGVKIAIDDFGMGHSSLVYLKQFPVAMIKLDGSLVKDVAVSKISSDIISSISELCKSMEIELLAEFVETESQARMLKELGCHIFQGWLYSAALSPHACEEAIIKGFRTY